jgi:hypothetical protein
VKVPAGTTEGIRFTFTRKGARLLRRLERLPLTLVIRVRVAGQGPRPVTRTIVVEPPA